MPSYFLRDKTEFALACDAADKMDEYGEKLRRDLERCADRASRKGFFELQRNMEKKAKYMEKLCSAETVSLFYSCDSYIGRTSILGFLFYEDFTSLKDVVNAMGKYPDRYEIVNERGKTVSLRSFKAVAGRLPFWKKWFAQQTVRKAKRSKVQLT